MVPFCKIHDFLAIHEFITMISRSFSFLAMEFKIEFFAI